MTSANPDTDQHHLIDESSTRRRVVEFLIFAVVALFFMFTMGPLFSGVDFANQDLIDTDGHMRYLRVEQMLDEGPWFDPMSMRSNYPYGETQHWTRIVDVYIAALALLMLPFLGAGALYGAAVVNGPLVFIAIGAATYWAFSTYIPRSVRPISMPLLIVFWPVVLYTLPARMDHHAPIMLAFVVTFGWVLRCATEPTRRNAIHLGIWAAIGMWISVEFLVALALIALTLGVFALTQPSRPHARYAAEAFIAAAVAQAVFVLIERGPGWSTVELDRISTVHVGLAVVIGLVFGTYSRFATALGPWQRFGLLSGLSVVGLALLLLWHPEIAKGPFGEVDPVVQEIWLFHVVELRPLLDRGLRPALIPFVLPVIIGIVTGLVQLRAKKPMVGVILLWLATYTFLMIAQVRWTSFAQLLALPLVLSAIATPYEKMGSLKAAPLLRPLILAVLIVGLPMFGPLLAASGDGGSAFNCRVRDAVHETADMDPTTVFAMQDVGPEMLYRSNHNVIATPYHRNEQGILFVRDVMSMTDHDQVQEELATRDVGLILICPGRNDLTRPPDIAGTFYQDLVEGPLPDFVTSLPLEGETDWLLFRVES